MEAVLTREEWERSMEYYFKKGLSATERAQLEYELKQHGVSVVLDFVNSPKTFCKLEEVLSDDDLVNALGVLRALAVSLSPADLDVSTTIDLVRKNS